MRATRKKTTQKTSKKRAPSLLLSEKQPTPLRNLGPNYTNAFVTFIDILGFKELIKSLPANEINSKLRFQTLMDLVAL